MRTVSLPSLCSPRVLLLSALTAVLLLTGLSLSLAPTPTAAAGEIYACTNNSTGRVSFRSTCLTTETRFNLNDRVSPVTLTVMTANGQVYYRRAPSTGSRISLNSPGTAPLRFCYQLGTEQPLFYFGTTCPSGWRFLTVPQRTQPPVAGNDAYATNEDTAFTTGNVLANDTDYDGDALAVSDFNDASTAGALVESNGDGTFDYDPTVALNGLDVGESVTDTFNYVVTDGFGGFDQATVSIVVTGVNDAPTAADFAFSVPEDGSAAITLGGGDVDGDPLTFSVVDAPDHGTLTGTAPNLTYQPAPNYTGPDSFTYKANDGALDSAVATASITVTAVNDAPVAVDDAGAGYATNENTVLTTANVLANDTDPEGDTLTVSDVDATSAGGAAVDDNGDGTFDYDPRTAFNALAAGQTATDQFTYTVSDGTSESAPATVTITVTGVNDAPTAVDDTAEVSEAGPAISFNILANDTDPESDTLAVTSANVSGLDGALSLTSTGATTYHPNGQFEALGAGETATDIFTYTISDGQGGTDTGTVTITITGVNDAPTAVAQSVSTDEDTPLTITLAGTDVEGSTLTFAVGTGPTKGSLGTIGTVDCTTTPGTCTADVLYTPNANTNGADSFTFTVNDGTVGSAAATVTITVDAVNDAPTATDDTATVSEDGPAISFNILANDTDPESDTLAVTSANVSGLDGALSLTSTGATTYHPNGQFETLGVGETAEDTFTYTISDGNGGTDTGTVTITIEGANDAPVANGNAFATDEDTALTTGNVLANDTDVDGDSLSVDGIDTTGTQGTVTDNEDGTFGYDPNGQFEDLGVGESATDTFTYTVTDGTVTDTATVTITITGVNDAPTAVDDTATTGERSSTTVAVLANDTDPESDALTVASVDTTDLDEAGTDTQGTVTVAADGLSVTYDPNGAFDDLLDGETATDTFTYTVSDGNGGTDTATVTVTIEGVTNEAPVADDQTVTTAEDTGVAITLTATDTESDPFTFTVTTLPDAGTLYEGTDATGTVLTAPYDLAGATVFFVPAANENGSAYATFDFVADDGAASAPATITVDVTAVNDAPVAVAQSVSTNEDTALPITLTGTDVDGNTLTFAIGTAPSRGTLGTLGTPDCTTTPGTCTVAVTYTPTANLNGADSFTFTVNDGTAGSAAATVAITVDAVNDVPVATSQSVNTNEDTALTITLAATDADGTALTFAIASAPTNGTLGSIGTPVCTAGSCTASVTYTPTANANGPDSFTFTVNDGTATSAAATVTITVAAVNDAPALANIEATALAFTENAAATAVTAALTVSDVDSTTLTGATVGITAGYATGQDVLAFTAPAGSGITGSFNATTGRLTLDGDSSLANYEAALRSVTYANSSENPSTASRTVTFQVEDVAAVNSLSNLATRTIAVTSVNDAPVLAGIEATAVAATEQVAATVTATLTVTDVDSANLTGASVRFASGFVAGQDTLAFTNQLGITGTFNATTGVLNLTGTTTLANYQTALRSVTYTNTSNAPDTATTRTIGFVVNDGGAVNSLSTEATRTLTVTAVNDAPLTTGRAFGADSVETNMQRSILAADGLLNGATDPDTGGGFTSDLDVGTVNGIAPVSGTITTTITGKGTVVADAETGAFTFDPAPGVVGDVTIPFTVCDNGNPAPSACSTAVNATFTISGPVTWFVNPAAATNGTGTLASPFNTLAGADAVDAANHRIFIYSGTVTTGIALNSGEWLIGQGVTGAATFDALFGITVPSGTMDRPAVATGTATVGSTVTLASSVTVKGLALSTGTAAAMNDPAGAITGVSVDQVAVTTTTGAGVTLSDIAGSLSFSGLTTTGGTGASLTGSNGSATFNFTGVSVSSGANAAFTATGGGTVNVTGGTNTLTSTSGTTLALNGVGGTLAFSNVSKNGAGTGIDLTNVSAPVTIAAGSIQNTTLNGISLNGGTGAFGYPGTVSNTSGRTIQVQNRTVGTVTFSGAISGGGTGVLLASNAGATIEFSAGLTLSTGTNSAFTVSGGGTINVVGANTKSFTTTSGAGVLISGTASTSFTGGGLAIISGSGNGFTATGGTVAVTGTTNTIASTGGIALNVANTTIGASGLTFRSIAANGGANGIVLTNTGTSGGLTVTGTGSTAQGGDNSGGTIQSTTSFGVSLTNTSGPSFRNMRILNTGNSGINGTQVTGFSFTDGTITGAGDASDENSITFDDSLTATPNLTGAVTITNNVISQTEAEGVDIENWAGTISNANISGNALSDTGDVATPGSGITLIGSGLATSAATITRATVTNNTITDFRAGVGIQVRAGNPNVGGPTGSAGTAGSATNVIEITGNSMNGGTGGIGNQPDRFFTGGVSGNGGQGNFTISNNGTAANRIRNIDCIAIEVQMDGPVTMTSKIQNNFINPNSAVGCAGIAIGTDDPNDAGAGTHTTTVSGNNVMGTNGPGIYVIVRDSGSTMHAGVYNNTVAAPNATNAARAGIRADSGSAQGDTTLCVSISGNTTAGSTNTDTGTISPGINLRKQGPDPTINTFGIQGMTATASPGVENFVNGLNTSTSGTFGTGGTALLSATQGFTNCSTAPALAAAPGALLAAAPAGGPSGGTLVLFDGGAALLLLAGLAGRRRRAA